MSKHFTEESKKEILDRIQSGENVSKVAREQGISRTILYKWKQSSQPQEIPETLTEQPQEIPSEIPVSEDRHPRSFSLPLERRIVKLALKNPSYSPQKIASLIGVGHNGVWKVLKRNG